MEGFAEFMRRETAAAARLWGDCPGVASAAGADSLRRLRSSAREESRAESRRSALFQRRIQNRNENLPMTVEGEDEGDKRRSPPLDRARLRRAQLLDWKNRRDQMRAIEPKGRPPFKAGAFVRIPKEPPPLPAVATRKRITRASARNKPKPFAPPNAQFKPPTMLRRIETPPPPPKRKTRVFTDFLPNTPESPKRAPSEFVALNSPNVTLVRGKSGIPPAAVDPDDVASDKTAHHFRIQLDGEIARLLRLAEDWKNYRDGNRLDENHQDMINVVIGQTHLLIDKKFQQFRSLIERCETGEIVDGEGLVNVDDLQGFWDMVYMQVENLDIRFNELKNLKDRDWKDDTKPTFNVKKKRGPIKMNPPIITKKSSGLKAMILAARKKNMSGDEENPSVKIENQPAGDVITFNGGFFSVTSPAKIKNDLCLTPNKTPLRHSVLSNEAKKRLSVQTPINVKALLTANSYAKCIANNKEIALDESEISTTVQPIDLNKTPGKSILKTPLNKTVNSMNSKKQVKLVFSPEENNLACIKIDNEIETDYDHKENILKKHESKENRPKQIKRQSKRILAKQSNVDISPLGELEFNKFNSKMSPIINSTSDDILIEDPSATEQTGGEASDSFLEVFGISKKSKRMSHIRNSLKSIEDNRKSVNLISFESPQQPAYATRSVLKRTTAL